MVMAGKARRRSSNTLKDALIFIDTNIFLDFYRVRNSGDRLSILDHIGDNQDRIITGIQVEMEYKKNRQKVILDTVKGLKFPNKLSIPTFLSEARPVKTTANKINEIQKQKPFLDRRIEAILKNPSKQDPIFQVLQRLFRGNDTCNLRKSSDTWQEIYDLAFERFLLGYPPRKKDDTSFGDAINWEWIVHCAQAHKKDVIIVSRDSDYGELYPKEPMLNNWLEEEFKKRVSRKRKIVLTNRLAQAFKLASIGVTRKEEKSEQELLEKMHELTEELRPKLESLRETILRTVASEEDAS